MSLLIAARGMGATKWKAALLACDANLDVRVWPDIGNAGDIVFACAWNPAPHALANLPSLRGITSLGAGVDRLLEDPTIPEYLPLARIIDERLAGAMGEYVLFHALRLLRGYDALRQQQACHEWRHLPSGDPGRWTVGIMGLGEMGRCAVQLLHSVGFRVKGWSRRPKSLQGVETYSGKNELDSFLQGLDLLVCLLPLTSETRDLLNADLFSRLPRGVHILNAGRGGHLNEADLLVALDNGQISSATLDVFATEPLPVDHPFWDHPRIYITPHNAADSEPDSVASQIVENYRRIKAGQAMLNLVNRGQGY